MNTTDTTRADALHYVSLTLGDFTEDYDMEAITDDVHQQLGHWDFAAMDQDQDLVLDENGVPEVDYWAAVARHERPISSAAVPGCPVWCTLDKGHEYEIEEPGGALSGFHEGIVATVTDDDGGQVTLRMVQHITRQSDGSVTVRPAYVTLTTTAGGTEYTSAASLRDLGDAIRKTAGKLEQLAGSTD